MNQFWNVTEILTFDHVCFNFSLSLSSYSSIKVQKTRNFVRHFSLIRSRENKGHYYFLIILLCKKIESTYVRMYNCEDLILISGSMRSFVLEHSLLVLVPVINYMDTERGILLKKYVRNSTTNVRNPNILLWPPIKIFCVGPLLYSYWYIYIYIYIYIFVCVYLPVCF